MSDATRESPPVALVTGATSGIGRATAERLGERGWTVLVHGRDPDRGREVVAAIEDRGGTATFHRADFADLAAVRDLADRVREEYDRLDALVNNAALSRGDRRVHELAGDGPRRVEETLLVNHLAPYLLTHELSHLLVDAEGRVVVTASSTHRRGAWRFDDLALDDGYDALDAYARSKLANVLFTRELARRLAGTGTTANCVHPGFVPGTRLYRDSAWYVRLFTRLASGLPGVGLPVEAGADGPVYLATDPDVADVSGAYFDGRTRERPSAAARDDDLARRLWVLSAHLVGVDPAWPGATDD